MEKLAGEFNLQGSGALVVSNRTSVLTMLLPKKPFRLIWQTQTSMGCAAKAGTPITNWSTYQWKDGRVYNYAKQEERDSFAKRLFAEHNVGIMDLEPLRYRPDAHVGVGSQSHLNDCVHFCVPGPLNALLPALFLHALRSVPRFLD